MSTSLESLASAPRLLFAIPLRPVQGSRFQPTGFPGLGAATYQTPLGTSLLVESAQSMANRLEAVCWDEAHKAPIAELAGLSHVTVTRKGAFFTDTMIEAHRLNSPYLLESQDKGFLDELKKQLTGFEEGPIDRRKLATCCSTTTQARCFTACSWRSRRWPGGGSESRARPRPSSRQTESVPPLQAA